MVKLPIVNNYNFSAGNLLAALSPTPTSDMDAISTDFTFYV